MPDWTKIEAKKLADIARRHGLRCRVVSCRNTDSYAAIYRDPEDASFGEKYNAVMAEAKEANWDGFQKILCPQKTE